MTRPGTHTKTVGDLGIHIEVQIRVVFVVGIEGSTTKATTQSYH